MNNKCSCIVCHKEFSILGFPSHYSTVHTIEGQAKINAAAKKGGNTFKENVNKFTQNKKEEYYKTPKYCLCCNEIIPYEKRENSFCSSSCSCKYSNANRTRNKWSQEQRNNVKIKNLKIIEEQKEAKKYKKTKKEQFLIIKEATNNPVGTFSTINYCNCSHCRILFTNRSKKKYCDNCEHLYSHSGRAKYWFTFNVFHYPDLFDLEWLQKIGFRNSKINPNGITRDHKISVNAAIKNGYDPYYIKHPLNCELMLFEDNNKKKTKCSITYNELVQAVDLYNEK